MERQSAGLGPFALGNTPKKPGNVKMRDYKKEEFTKRKPVMDFSPNLFPRQKSNRRVPASTSKCL